jgi:hypothetical protein
LTISSGVRALVDLTQMIAANAATKIVCTNEWGI